MDSTVTVSPTSTAPVVLHTHVVRSISRHERLYMLLAIAVFTLTAVYKATTVPLWLDEFFTLFLSRLSSISELMKAIPADGQPPLQYFLTHLSLAWLGGSALSVRLPELLAYVAVGLLTYRVVRRHGTAIQALFALALVMGGTVDAQQAYAARPYELVLAFTALAFACWQVAASREKERILPLCGVTLGIAGAILSHHFGIIFVGVFLAAGEVTRLVQRRRLDGGMLAAIAAGLLPLIITLPLAYQSHILLGEPVLHSRVFCCRPSITDLLTYRMMAPFLLLLCLVVMVIFVRHSKHSDANSGATLPPVPAHEWAATAGLCLLVPIQVVLAAVATNYFIDRYAIATSLGLALLGGWGLPRVGRLRKTGQSVLALGTLYFLIVVAARLVLMQVNYPAWNAQPGKRAVSALLLDAPPGLPVVVANAFDYASEWWYSPPALRKRLIYLSDESYAVKQRDFLPELSLDIDKAYIPLPTSKYAAFLRKHPDFFLLCTGMTRRYWLPSRLSRAGWHLDPIARSGKNVLYRVDWK